MTFTITFGWWLVPAAITLASLAWAVWMQDPDTGGDYNFTGLFNAVWYLIALVPSLAAWLIWSIFQ